MQDTGTKIFLLIIVIVTGLMLTAAVVWGGAKSAVAPAVDIKNVSYAADAYVGTSTAPVTIAFWSDYQCPVCKSFELTTLPQLIKDYVDTGKVKLVFMDFAFLGADSTTAALYGRSVWKLYPNLYMKWREAMYTAQDAEGDKGFGDSPSIDALNATIAGLDAAKIAADVKANTSAYQAMIDADRVETTKAHLTGTPSFVIGTQLLVGNQPYPVFQSAINALVK